MNLALIEDTSGDLRISADDDARQELQHLQEEWDRRGVASDQRLYEVLEWYFCNGWEWINPEEIGALTSSPLFSHDVERDDEGMITHIGRVYYDKDYMLRDPIDEIIADGFVIFPGVD